MASLQHSPLPSLPLRRRPRPTAAGPAASRAPLLPWRRRQRQRRCDSLGACVKAVRHQSLSACDGVHLHRARLAHQARQARASWGGAAVPLSQSVPNPGLLARCQRPTPSRASVRPPRLCSRPPLRAGATCACDLRWPGRVLRVSSAVTDCAGRCFQAPVSRRIRDAGSAA